MKHITSTFFPTEKRIGGSEKRGWDKIQTVATSFLITHESSVFEQDILQKIY